MSANPPAHGEGEVRLDPETIEALARRLTELLSSAEERRPPKRLITAEEAAQRWEVSRRWVYQHAEWLGARPIGTGRRPRLRFDPDEVAERLGEPGPNDGDMRRSARIGGDCGSDSLSVRSGAMVRRQSKKRPGRRDNAPRPGAEGGPPAR